MGGRVAVVDDELWPAVSNARSISGSRCRPALEGVLEVCEGQAGIGPSEGGVESHRHPKEMLGLVVVRPGEAVHVPETAVIRLPGVQRVRWFENCAIAFDHLDLAGDRRDDPVADLVEDEESLVELVVERFRPDDSGGSRLGKLDRYSDAAFRRRTQPLAT